MADSNPAQRVAFQGVISANDEALFDSEDEAPGTPPGLPDVKMRTPKIVPCQGSYCSLKTSKNLAKWKNSRTFEKECDFCAPCYTNSHQRIVSLPPDQFGEAYVPVNHPLNVKITYEKYSMDHLVYRIKSKESIWYWNVKAPTAVIFAARGTPAATM